MTHEQIDRLIHMPLFWSGIFQVVGSLIALYFIGRASRCIREIQREVRKK